MPRKTSVKLEKVVSTNIPWDYYLLLEKYTRIYYNSGQILQPTISHLVRGLIASWVSTIRKKEEKAANNKEQEPSKQSS